MWQGFWRTALSCQTAREGEDERMTEVVGVNGYSIDHERGD